MKISSLQKGLVAHWTMSQDSLKGSLLADKTPYENDGTIYGATFATDRKGQPNSAMSFDGVDDYIEVVNNNSLNLGIKSFTFSFWMKSNAINNFGGILSSVNGSLDGVALYSDGTNNVLRCFIKSSDTAYNAGYSFYDINPFDNNWNYIVFIVDRELDLVSAYQNGIKSNYNLGISAVGNINSSNFILGKQLGPCFNGSIDDVRIYNRVLSQAEITKLYESYNPGLKLYGGDYKIKSEGYIRVDKNVNNAIYFDNPESNLYGKTYFYVMKYQARNNGGVPKSTGDGLPWTNISQLDAIQKSKDAGYHLITNWEWMAIARDIEQVADNWTGGAVGSGMIKRGNVGTTDDGSYNGANPETGILNDKAKLKLSNGEEIYHFSGNVWELVDAQIPTQADMKPTGRYWPGEIKDVTDWGNGLAYSEIGPKDNTLTRSNGVGGIYYDTIYTSNRAFLRGGDWGDGAGAGVFALFLGLSPTGTGTGFGFRCARYGNE